MSRAVMTENESQLGLVFQYTLEAYKTFQKLAELLQNPMSAAMFKAFAREEREHRDLLEIKYVSSGKQRMQLTLGADLRFQDMLEGDLSYREMAEFLISRERSMEMKLREFAKAATESDRNLLIYLAASKRAHVTLIERELEMIKTYPDWFKREDALDLVVHGKQG